MNSRRFIAAPMVRRKVTQSNNLHRWSGRGPPEWDRMPALGYKQTCAVHQYRYRPKAHKISLIVYVNGQPNLPRQPMRIALSWGTASKLGGTKNWETGARFYELF